MISRVKQAKDIVRDEGKVVELWNFGRTRGRRKILSDCQCDTLAFSGKMNSEKWGARAKDQNLCGARPNLTKPCRDHNSKCPFLAGALVTLRQTFPVERC
jgi:hypothetical protein